MALEDKHKQEAEEVIEGLLMVLSYFEYLPNQFKRCLPAIENAQEFLGKIKKED